MFEKEAIWLSGSLVKYGGSDLSPLLDVGSSTLTYRTIIQPWIENDIFSQLRKKGITIIHFDKKKDDGIDITGDIESIQFSSQISDMKFRSIFLFSILEHVMNRQIIAKNIDKVLEEGGLLFVTCPFNYPYHRDPIDTLFRPGVEEIGELFPQMKVLSHEIVTCYSYPNSLLKNFQLIFIQFFSFAREGTFDENFFSIKNLKMCLKRDQVTCVILKKNSTNHGTGPGP